MPRIGIDNFDDALGHSRAKMADGLIKGEGFGSIITGILHFAAAYGGDEAERAKFFPATVNETNFDELTRRVVFSSTEDLFHNVSLSSIVRNAFMAGSAFGFAAVKNKVLA